MLKRIVIRSYEVGLKFREGEFKGLSGTGKHWIFDPLNKLRVRVVSKRDPWLADDQLDVIVKSGALAGKAEVLDLKDYQRALVWIDGRFARILSAGLYAYWTGVREVRVEVVDSRDVRFEHKDLKSIVRAAEAARLLDICKVERDHVGVLFIDGRYIGQLEPGLYAYWKDAADSRVVELDMRESQIDVSGQEIMTLDKMTLRMNAIGTYAINDARRAVSASSDMSYRLTQSEFRAKHLASYDAAAVEQYEAWTRQIGEAYELAVLADIAQVFEFAAGLSVLDAGAGTGAMCRILRRIGGLDLTALEPSSLMLERLINKLELDSVRTCQGFCDSPEDQSLFPPDCFDVIVSRQLANGLYDPLAAMANWRHWLKSQGVVLLIDGFYSRSAWASLGTDFADCLPLAANQSLATVPYLLEIAGFTVTHAGMMQAINALPSTRTEKYLVVAKVD